MKILMTCYDIADYGGIALQVEIIKKGLRKLGHSVDFVLLRNVDRDPYMKKESTHIPGTFSSRVGNQVNAIYGWYGVPVHGYGSKKRLREWRRFASQYDGILHQIPVPKPDPRGYWRGIYDLGAVPQMAVVHDVHFLTYYPHLIDVADNLIAIAATNDAQFNSTATYPGPRYLVPTAHILADWDEEIPWRRRKPRFVSAHVWKRLKRMDRVLRALPLLGDEIENVIGGDGIEARYMRSKDKCKEEYRGLWKRALKAGMNYKGLMVHDALLRAYSRARVQVDLSYTEKGVKAGYGMAPNRSLLEAFNYGCVSILDEDSAQGWILKPGEHILTVEHEAPPKLLAEVITEACTMHHDDANEMLQRGRDLMRLHWDYKKCARGYVRILQGKTGAIGMYGTPRPGKLTKATEQARDTLLAKVEA